MTKIHPHLKHFIKSVILTEIHDKLGPSKNYLWKEVVMKQVQEIILEQIDSVKNQKELEVYIDRIIAEFTEKQLIPLLNMIRNTLKTIPLEILKKR